MNRSRKRSYSQPLFEFLVFCSWGNSIGNPSNAKAFENKFFFQILRFGLEQNVFFLLPKNVQSQAQYSFPKKLIIWKSSVRAHRLSIYFEIAYFYSKTPNIELVQFHFGVNTS